LTRRSIFLRRMMDARVKPAHDADVGTSANGDLRRFSR
jgi:hypothetical protein